MIIEEKKFGEDILKYKTNGETKVVNCLTEQSSFNTFLDDANDLTGNLSDIQRQQLITLFANSTKNTYEVFEDASYTKIAWKLFNKALFESMSVAMAFCNYDKIKQNKIKIYKGFKQLLAEEDFFTSITSATQTEERVKTRFGKIKELLQEYV
jgi:hypothetical protein